MEVFREGRADAALAASIFHYGFSQLADLKQEIEFAGNSREVAVLIPSIDLMGGKVVQLVQGKKKALEFDDFEEWVERFSAISAGAVDRPGCGDWNRQQRHAGSSRSRSGLPCQVGGGIRSVEAAQKVLGSRREARDCRIVAVRLMEQIEIANLRRSLAAELWPRTTGVCPRCDWRTGHDSWLAEDDGGPAVWK